MAFIACFLFLSGLTACAVGIVTHFVARRFNKRRGYTLGFLITFFVMITVLFYNAQSILESYTVSGFGVSAEEANKHLFAFKLPPEATDVNYYHNPFLGTDNVADFKIDEESFLIWAAKNGWKMKQFGNKERISDEKPLSGDEQGAVYSSGYPVHPVRSYVDEDFDKAVEIHNGYYCCTIPPHSDMGETICYDLDTSRAYIESCNR